LSGLHSVTFRVLSKSQAQSRAKGYAIRIISEAQAAFPSVKWPITCWVDENRGMARASWSQAVS
jgi:hypothetical protein